MGVAALRLAFIFHWGRGLTPPPNIIPPLRGSALFPTRTGADAPAVHHLAAARLGFISHSNGG